MAHPLLSPKLRTQGAPFLWAEHTYTCSWALFAIGRSMGGIYPGQSAARTGCDHWLRLSAIHGGSAVQGQGGGALTWSVVAHWVHRLWGFPVSPGQGQPPPVFWPGPLCLSYKAIWDGCYLCWAWRFHGKPSCESRLAAANAMHVAHWGRLLHVC